MLFGQGVGVEDLGWCVSKGCSGGVLAWTDLVHRHVGGSWEGVFLWDGRSAVLGSTMSRRLRKQVGRGLRRMVVAATLTVTEVIVRWMPQLSFLRHVSVTQPTG